MKRYSILIISLFFSCLTYAGAKYQVDLILFSHPQSGTKNIELALDSPMLPTPKNAIVLSNARSDKPYHLLSPTKSSLRDQYYLINRKHHYHMLGHYSWIQPSNNQSSVVIPLTDRSGWQMQGTIRIKQSNYYTFDAQFQLSPPSHPNSTFMVKQKQRILGGKVYYLDHPQLGMVVKIHRVS